MQSYYEARFGKEAWDALDKIPRELWMEYLMWYREVLNIPVLNSCKVLKIEPIHASQADAGFKVSVLRNGQPDYMYTRKVSWKGGQAGRQA